MISAVKHINSLTKVNKWTQVNFSLFVHPSTPHKLTTPATLSTTLWQVKEAATAVSASHLTTRQDSRARVSPIWYCVRVGFILEQQPLCHRDRYRDKQHSQVHSLGQFTVYNLPNVHVFGPWVETGEPRENPSNLCSLSVEHIAIILSFLVLGQSFGDTSFFLG